MPEGESNYAANRSLYSRVSAGRGSVGPPVTARGLAGESAVPSVTGGPPLVANGSDTIGIATLPHVVHVVAAAIEWRPPAAADGHSGQRNGRTLSWLLEARADAVQSTTLALDVVQGLAVAGPRR